MRLIFLGSGAFALPTLRWLAGGEHEIPLVVTQPSRPSGRGRKTTPTPVFTLANELGLETLEPEDVNAPDVVAGLRSLDAQLGLVVAFGQKLSPELLTSLPGGFINLHASLLPRLRGAAPINWAILRGERQTGCTVFRVVERMDAGPVLTERSTEIKSEETAGELHDRLAEIGIEAVEEVLRLCEGGATPEGTPQNEAEATHARKIRKADGFVRFDRPVATVTTHVRAMTPWPGAATQFRSAGGRWERVMIVRTRRAEGPATPSLPPGTIDERGHVAALDGFVEILQIKPSSGRIMTWGDYVNGRHVEAGDSFVTPES